VPLLPRNDPAERPSLEGYRPRRPAAGKRAATAEPGSCGLRRGHCDRVWRESPRGAVDGVEASATRSPLSPWTPGKNDIRLIVCYSGRIAPISVHDDVCDRRTRARPAHDHGATRGLISSWTIPRTPSVGYASDTKRHLSPTPSTPIGHVGGAGDRSTILSVAWATGSRRRFRLG
jgi:hypothetical protein